MRSSVADQRAGGHSHLISDAGVEIVLLLPEFFVQNRDDATSTSKILSTCGRRVRKGAPWTHKSDPLPSRPLSLPAEL